MATKAQDLLRDYKAKRDFAKTQEPSGGAPTAGSGGWSFVVQKHDATRLHYDFRIELDGVLKSWAVTKGPSNNPADKRLAVRVEDHPLEYGGFEGTIPEGEYGGGTVMLWDRGTWEPIGDPHEGLEKGDLKMRLSGERMKGEWVLVHMKGRDTKRKSGPDRENWLLIKHRDGTERDKDTLTTRFTRSVASGRDFKAIASGAKPEKKTKVPAKAVWHSDPEEAEKADQKTRLPARSKPGKTPDFQPVQLATLVDTVPSGDKWLFEMKYDGYRCLASVAGDSVRLFTRNGLDWTEQFGAMVPPLSRITRSVPRSSTANFAPSTPGGEPISPRSRNTLSDGGRLTYFAFDLIEQPTARIWHETQADRAQGAGWKSCWAIGRKASSLVQYLAARRRQRTEGVRRDSASEGHEGIVAKQRRRALSQRAHREAGSRSSAPSGRNSSSPAGRPRKRAVASPRFWSAPKTARNWSIADGSAPASTRTVSRKWLPSWTSAARGPRPSIPCPRILPERPIG
jgi:bifunctional non-homologous end joining protein LigD